MQDNTLYYLSWCSGRPFLILAGIEGRPVALVFSLISTINAQTDKGYPQDEPLPLLLVSF
jgi:hypothetical protein